MNVIMLEAFRECQLQFDRHIQSVRLLHATSAGNFALHFHLYKIDASQVVHDAPSLLHSLNAFEDPSNPATPADAFALLLWETLDMMNGQRLWKSSSNLNVAFHSNNPFGPRILPSLLSGMPNIQTMCFMPSDIYRKHSLLGLMVPLFGNLERLVVHITNGSWTRDLKNGLAHFTTLQKLRGKPIREVLLVISAGLGRASMGVINLIVGELREEIPSEVSIKWVHG
ncbi:hypothetical protein NMY22_g4209 [Coprinellus aureogranulatus]|nr:hypothetical protein NMY22_g4209 [Coprinellus aureogranulatus]